MRIRKITKKEWTSKIIMEIYFFARLSFDFRFSVIKYTAPKINCFFENYFKMFLLRSSYFCVFRHQMLFNAFYVTHIKLKRFLKKCIHSKHAIKKVNCIKNSSVFILFFVLRTLIAWNKCRQITKKKTVVLLTLHNFPNQPLRGKGEKCVNGTEN